MVWLVEPPVAASAAMALTMAFVDEPIAVVVAESAVQRNARSTAARSASRKGVPGFTNEAPGSCRPIARAATGWNSRCRRTCRCPARGSWRIRRPAVPRAWRGRRRKAFAHLGLLFVGMRRHRPGGHEQHRQVAERERADQQAGHDLVAHAEATMASNMSWLSATAVACAITSRENSESSMPGGPGSRRRNIAGTPPATARWR